MEGEEERSEKEGSFSKASIPKRIAIVAAGGLVNILFALIVYFILLCFTGNNVSTIIDGPISGTGADGFYYTYDCGPITQAGSYRFNTTFRSTNFPNTTRSFSTVFTFSAN